MKKILLSSLFLFIISLANSANFTSVMNGNWSNPLTWGSSSAVPMPGDQVTVNHIVTLDVHQSGYWSVNAGTLTIGNNGTLQANASVIGIAIQNGGQITNNGQLKINQLGNYAGTFTNNGTAHLYQLIYNLSTIHNYGTIDELDSLYSNSSFSNHTNGTVTSDSLWAAGAFVNDGTLNLHEMTNDGTFTNNGTINFRRITNLSIFYNNGTMDGEIDATNSGKLYLNTGSTFNLQNSFSNIDNVNNDAVLYIEGTLTMGDGFFNADTIRGVNGQINIANETGNSGWFKGSFFFCDATPPSNSPFIDYNTGSIEAGVRYCVSEGIQVISPEQALCYPNPTNGIINWASEVSDLVIFDISGQKIFAKTQNAKILDARFLNCGIYIIQYQQKGMLYRHKLIKE